MTDFTSPQKGIAQHAEALVETSKPEAQRSGDTQVEDGLSTALDLLRVPQLPKGQRERPPRADTPFSPHQALSLTLILLGDFSFL